MITKVVLRPGTQLLIEFEDEDGCPTDGQFSVDFDTKKFPEAVFLKESAGLPGNIKGNANEILYHEDYQMDESIEVTKVESVALAAYEFHQTYGCGWGQWGLIPALAYDPIGLPVFSGEFYIGIKNGERTS